MKTPSKEELFLVHKNLVQEELLFLEAQINALQARKEKLLEYSKDMWKLLLQDIT